jgi:hypothetical protein
MRGMETKILLTATVGWPSIARLAGGFAMASCTVDALSPAGAPVTVSRYVSTCHVYRPLLGLSSLRAAIADSQPDLVVPCDDRAVMHLLRLHKDAVEAGGENSPLALLIARSLGRPESYAAVMSRSDAIAAVREAAVRAPLTLAVPREDDLADVLARIGLPAVLKSDGSWGGDGVIIVNDREQAHAAYRRLANPPSRLRSVARALRRRDAHHLGAAMTPQRPNVSAQAFVPGRSAASAFACWKGEIVGSIYYDVLVADGAIGPPNVIQRVDCPEMEEASRRVARRFGLSGLHGIDFIRDADGAVHLIEINPRATQGGTLAFGRGHDLPSALAGCIAPAGVRPAISSDTVALFPREWLRDPNSPYLSSGHHDVPWDDPAVLHALLASMRPNGSAAPGAAFKRHNPAGVSSRLHECVPAPTAMSVSAV